MPNPAEPPAAALLTRFRASRSEADFRALYRAHTPRLYGLALRLAGGSRRRSDELVQETWVRAVERLDRFAARSRFETWLAGILVNCHRESARRWAKRLLQFDPVRQPEPVEPAAVPPVARIDVERALADLPAGYREVVVLHDVEGYTHREIGELLGIEEGTSKSQLARGRTRLRRLLDGSRKTNRGERA